MTDWRPIETAPKDGTVVDLWSARYGRITHQWMADDGSWSGWFEEESTITHWMPVPLPPPPQDGEAPKFPSAESDEAWPR